MSEPFGLHSSLIGCFGALSFERFCWRNITRIHQDTQGYPHDTPGYTRIYQDTPGYTRIHQDTPGCTRMHTDDAKAFTSAHQNIHAIRSFIIFITFSQDQLVHSAVIFPNLRKNKARKQFDLTEQDCNTAPCKTIFDPTAAIISSQIYSNQSWWSIFSHTLSTLSVKALTKERGWLVGLARGETGKLLSCFV